MPLTLDQKFSIGEKSGEYGGRNINLAPAFLIDISKKFQYTSVTKFQGSERHEKPTSVSMLKSGFETVTVGNNTKDSRYTYQILPVDIKYFIMVELMLLSAVSQFHIWS